MKQGLASAYPRPPASSNSLFFEWNSLIFLERCAINAGRSRPSPTARGANLIWNGRNFQTDCCAGFANGFVVHAEFVVLFPSVWASAWQRSFCCGERPLPDRDDHLVCQREPPPNTLACVSGGTASTRSRRTSSGRLWAEQRSLLLWQQSLPPTVGESINRGSESECAQCQGPCDRKGKYFIGGVLWVTLETA